MIPDTVLKKGQDGGRWGEGLLCISFLRKNALECVIACTAHWYHHNELFMVQSVV